MTTDTPLAAALLDVRDVPCTNKLRMIRTRWLELPVGDHFVLVNGHDPVPLRYQMDAEFPGAFTWDYLQHDPHGVQIKITKLKPISADLDRQWSCPSSGGSGEA